MLVLHSSLMRPHQPTFQQRCHPMDPGEKVLIRFCRFSFAALENPFVLVSGQARVSRPSIRHQGAAGFNRLFDEMLQRLCAGVRDLKQSYPTYGDRFSLNLFCRNSQKGLGSCASSSWPLLRSTPKCLVNLHNTLQSIPAGSDHRLPKLVQHQPGRAVRVKPQDPLKTLGADAVFLAGDMPHPAKPNRQWKLGILKNGSGHHRTLTFADITPPQVPANGETSSISARWAYETFWPTDGRQVCPAAGIVGEGSFQLQKRFGVVGHPAIHYILGWVESSAYAVPTNP